MVHSPTKCVCGKVQLTGRSKCRECHNERRRNMQSNCSKQAFHHMLPPKDLSYHRRILTTEFNKVFSSHAKLIATHKNILLEPQANGELKIKFDVTICKEKDSPLTKEEWLFHHSELLDTCQVSLNKFTKILSSPSLPCPAYRSELCKFRASQGKEFQPRTFLFTTPGNTPNIEISYLANLDLILQQLDTLSSVYSAKRIPGVQILKVSTDNRSISKTKNQFLTIRDVNCHFSQSPNACVEIASAFGNETLELIDAMLFSTGLASQIQRVGSIELWCSDWGTIQTLESLPKPYCEGACLYCDLFKLPLSFDINTLCPITCGKKLRGPLSKMFCSVLFVWPDVSMHGVKCIMEKLVRLLHSEAKKRGQMTRYNRNTASNLLQTIGGIIRRTYTLKTSKSGVTKPDNFKGREARLLLSKCGALFEWLSKSSRWEVDHVQKIKAVWLAFQPIVSLLRSFRLSLVQISCLKTSILNFKQQFLAVYSSAHYTLYMHLLEHIPELCGVWLPFQIVPATMMQEGEEGINATDRIVYEQQTYRGKHPSGLNRVQQMLVRRALGVRNATQGNNKRFWKLVAKHGALYPQL